MLNRLKGNVDEIKRVVKKNKEIMEGKIVEDGNKELYYICFIIKEIAEFGKKQKRC